MSKQNQIVKQIIEAEYSLSSWELERIKKGETNPAEEYKKKIGYMIEYRKKDLKEVTEKIASMTLLYDLCDELFKKGK